MHKPPSKYMLAKEAKTFLDANPDIEKFAMLYTDLPRRAARQVVDARRTHGGVQSGRCLPGSVMSMDVTGRDVEETGLVWDDGDADRLVWPVPGHAGAHALDARTASAVSGLFS